MREKPNKLVLGVLVVISVTSAALAWRDLARRSDSQVRGSKKAWRVVIVLNPGNSFAYWVFGRR